MTSCPSCEAATGTPHDDGCSIARCTACGLQRISCEHGSQDVGWGQTWTGRYPGEDDVARLGLADLNDLGKRAMAELLIWDQQAQQWEHNPAHPDAQGRARTISVRPDTITHLPGTGLRVLHHAGRTVDFTVEPNGRITVGADCEVWFNPPAQTDRPASEPIQIDTTAIVTIPLTDQGWRNPKA